MVDIAGVGLAGRAAGRVIALVVLEAAEENEARIVGPAIASVLGEMKWRED